jgi:hypothetical protein
MKCRTFFLVLLMAATILLGSIAFRSRPLPIASNISSSPNDSPSQPIDNSRPQQPARAITGPAAPPKDSRTAAIADITERRDQQIAEIKRRASGFRNRSGSPTSGAKPNNKSKRSFLTPKIARSRSKTSNAPI